MFSESWANRARIPSVNQALPKFLLKCVLLTVWFIEELFVNGLFKLNARIKQ